MASLNGAPAMPGRASIWPPIAVVGLVAMLFISGWTATLAQSRAMPPIATPFPTPDFHYSDPARDAAYWRLQIRAARAHTAFYRSIDAARRALFRDDPRLIRPAALGTPAWLQARAAAEQAIRARRPVRIAGEAETGKRVTVTIFVRKQPKA